ncbi:MAG: ATP-binding protein [Anaerolineae bacterium]
MNWLAGLILFSGISLVFYIALCHLFKLSPVAYRSVIHSMVDGVLVLDRRGCVVEANPAAAQMLGQPARELTGKHLDELHPALHASLPHTEDCAVELSLGHDDASRTYQVSASELTGWRGRSRGRVLVFHDITERKELEEARAGITQAMVHDLRDPISNSIFALEMLGGDLLANDSPDSEMLLELAHACTVKTLHLIDEILLVGRLESGEVPVKWERVSLSKIVHSVLEDHALLAHDKQLHIQCDMPDTLPSVWADPGLVERVFQNLIDNSMKFTPVGGSIRVTAATGAPPNDQRLFISITDTGPGIPLNIQEELFDKYVTGGVRGSGSGLGLAFCKLALEAHGERIWVESVPGEGATFVFTLATTPTAADACPIPVAAREPVWSLSKPNQLA